MTSSGNGELIDGQLAAPAVPAPPRGPGVQPPFAAPPTDGNLKRRWIGLGVGGAALLLCCAGGIGGFIALAVSSSTERINEARTVVTKYMTAWQHEDYTGAYQLVCDEVKQRESLGEFSFSLSQRQIGSFVVQRPELATDATLVPVTLNFVDDGTEIDRYSVVVDAAGNSLVCGTQ
jgi:hypothetical protein